MFNKEIEFLTSVFLLHVRILNIIFDTIKKNYLINKFFDKLNY